MVILLWTRMAYYSMANRWWYQNPFSDKLLTRSIQDIKESRCGAQAKTSIWWPGILHDNIENTVRESQTCTQESYPQKELMIATDLPAYPWQKVGTDLFQLKGATYLLVDYFSRYHELKRLMSTTSGSIITALKSIFARFGIPEIVISDNGPQYASQEFRRFARTTCDQQSTLSTE